jgi:acetyl esterase
MFDREAADLLRVLDESFPPVQDMDPLEARAAVRARQAPVSNLDDVRAAEDFAVGPVRVRRYLPHAADLSEPPAVIVFAHGGGFVLCDVESHDGFCRSMARGTGAIVASVEYRRAPEHRAPTAVEDVYTALEWAAAEHPGSRLLVAGDSAGGNLAAAVALLARERGGPALHGQVLLYPVLDPGCDLPSQRSHGTGYFLTNAAMRWYWRQYLGDRDPSEVDSTVAPLRAASLAGLPPAVLVTGRLDPLWSEVVAYATALGAAGVPVILREYPELFHGFATIGPFGPGAAARSVLWDDLRSLARGVHSG